MKRMVTFILAGIAMLQPAAHARIGNEVLYQIITDRFHDGNPANNCGGNDASLTPEQALLGKLTCDPSRKDWNKYWGGDFEGILAKLDYIKNMGITQVWISPVVENARGMASGDGVIKSAYHGFWGRDWFRLNEHWTTNGTRDLDSFKSLVASTKKAGMGLIIDTVVNHTSPAYDAEYGAIYESGRRITDYLENDDDWFRRQPAIRWDLTEKAEAATALREYMFQHEMKFQGAKAADWEKFKTADIGELRHRMYQYYKLADLADLNTDHPDVRKYMERAHRFWADTGISGFRMDTVRHVSQEYFRQFVNDLRARNKDIILIGEWWGAGPQDEDSMKFMKNTGFTAFDFQLRDQLKELFIGKKNLARFAKFIDSSVDRKTGADTAADMVTFVDNHDMPRMMSEGASAADTMEMTKLLFGVRGVPCVYYGLETFLAEKKEGGKDPYNREMMVFPKDPSTAPGVRLVTELAAFRKAHPALRYGTTKTLKANDSVVVLQRDYQGDSVIVMVTKQGAVRAAPKGYVEKVLPGMTSGKHSSWVVSYFFT